jgi:hypothetical protein
MSVYIQGLEFMSVASMDAPIHDGIEYNFAPVALPNKVRVALKVNDSSMSFLQRKGGVSHETIDAYRAKNLAVLKAFATEYYTLESSDKYEFLALAVVMFGSPIVITKATDEKRETETMHRTIARLAHGTIER